MNAVIKAYTLSEAMEIMAEYASSYEQLGCENIIFCEDRLTLVAERALVRRLGGTFRSGVYTFARFLKAEGKTVSKQGSVMLVGEVMSSLQREGALQCFTTAATVAKNARCIYETLAQFAASVITPDLLKDSLAQLPEGTLKKKIADFALIYEGYTKALLERGFLDESKYLSLLPKRIREEGSLKGKTVFFLCYPSFTAQAKEIIRAAMETADNVVGIFIADDKEIYTNRAFDGFCSLFDGKEKPVVKDMGTPLDGAAELLRTGLFNPEVPAEKTPTDQIVICEAEDKTAEAELVAVKIRRLTAENSALRYRDFAVLTPSVDAYSLPIKKAFEEYGIPYFIDEKKSIKQHPVSKFLLDCCRTVKENFSPASVQSLTHNYFFGDSDEYRNYLYKFANYRGGATKPIKRGENVEAFLGVKDEEKKEERFEVLEDGRARLLLATQNIKAKGYGREYCAAIRKILVDFEVEKKLEDLGKKLEDLAQKGYLSQIYRALESVLSEAETLIGGKLMTVVEFAALLEDGFDAMEISLIPLKADAVFIGDITGSRIEKVSTLFALGMTDGALTSAADTSIISDKEIEQLSEVKAYLEPTVAEVNYRARESFCLNLCTFLDKLYLSYPLSADGSEPAISEIFRYIRTVFCSTSKGEMKTQKGLEVGDFPYQCAAASPAIRQLLIKKGENGVDYASVYAALKRLGVVVGKEYFLAREDTSHIQKGEALFFRDGKISPTSLEGYFGCPFGHFAERGLRLREREEAVVLATDSGDLVHKLLDIVAKQAREFATEEALRVFAREKCEELMEKSAYKAQQDTDVGSYASDRMLSEAVEVAAAVYRHIVNSSFVVEGREVPVEGENFRGKVDRVDGTDKYVRIIDYKTGGIDATPTAYYTGQKLQMELYMSEVKGTRIPAGVFYFPASTSFKKKDEEDGRYRMLGFLNGEEEALRTGDIHIQDGVKSEYFEASLKENSRLSKVMNEKTFVDFLDYAPLVAQKACAELKDGFVAPSPYEGKCAYCAYGGMCGFNREVDEVRSENAVAPTTIANIARKERDGEED